MAKRKIDDFIIETQKVDVFKILDRMIRRNFENTPYDNIERLADIINYNANWKKHYIKRKEIVLEIQNVLRIFCYFENRYSDNIENNPDINEDEILSSLYWDMANIVYIIIRKRCPVLIPISDEDSPYDYIMAVRALSNMDVNIDLPKSRYILNDYLTYVSNIWDIKYSDHYGLVQFLFFKFRDESEDFCRQMAAEIVSLLKSTGYKKDKQLLDRIKIFDSDEGISYPEYYKYYNKTEIRYPIDSKILNAIDRIAEQQFVNSISYQEQEVARINLLIRESYTT